MMNPAFARPSAVAALVSAVAFVTAGCSGASTPEEEAQATEADVTMPDGTRYFVLESLAQGGAATVSLVNGGSLRCPGGRAARSCRVTALQLPADCNWECQDGLLSLQGVSVLRGRFVGTRLEVTAGFDTWRAGIGTHTVYRLTPSAASCDHDPCPGAIVASRLGASARSTVTRVDFAHADDTNYVLDPARGYAQIASDAGLLASGTIDHGVFHADRVWRLWTPKPSCDPQQAARAYWFHGGEDVVDLELLTVREAESYADTMGRSVHWLVRTAQTAGKVGYTAGINDLWAVTFDVDAATCAISVTGEH